MSFNIQFTVTRLTKKIRISKLMSHVHLPAMPLRMLCMLVWRSAPQVPISSYASEWRGCSPSLKTAKSIFLSWSACHVLSRTSLSVFRLYNIWAVSAPPSSSMQRHPGVPFGDVLTPKMLHQLHKTTAHALAQQQHKHWQFSHSNQGFSCWPTVRSHGLPAVDICSGSRNLKSAE